MRVATEVWILAPVFVHTAKSPIEQNGNAVALVLCFPSEIMANRALDCTKWVSNDKLVRVDRVELCMEMEIPQM